MNHVLHQQVIHQLASLKFISLLWVCGGVFTCTQFGGAARSRRHLRAPTEEQRSLWAACLLQLRAWADLSCTSSLDGVRKLLVINYGNQHAVRREPETSARQTLFSHPTTRAASGCFVYRYFKARLSYRGPPFFLCWSLSISIPFCGCFATSGDNFWLM